MNINDLFRKDISRAIDGVIKADDEAKLVDELEEYVITNEIAKNLTDFFEQYNHYQVANGVWISGFFGSGKSHLLKMLAYLLENKPINGKRPSDYFIEKATANNDAFLKGAITTATAIPSSSILFNIDQKADQSAKEGGTAVLDAFIRVFNEHCGYYGSLPYVANLERDLDNEGKLELFKERFEALSGKKWEVARSSLLVVKRHLDQAFSEVTGNAVTDVIRLYRSESSKTIYDFCQSVRDYIEKQGPNYRLNFFVDEVGQFIAERSGLMVNLQTIAETLATTCNGRSWVIVTSQEDMDSMLGRYNKQQTNDFTKIQARFSIRLKLTSQNVSEVICKRLLAKQDDVVPTLTQLYEANKDDLPTLFTFVDGSRDYRRYNDSEDFVNTYPFVPYQFGLFQAAIRELSDCQAFEGRHSSVGERSMLGVFQEVLKNMKDQHANVGMLAPFDSMFEGIRMSLKSGIQRSILDAQNNLGENSLGVRILKALFLVKFVKEFKATVDNLVILLYPGFGTDIRQHKALIYTELQSLVRETYIEQDGNTYSYLSDDEKEVEAQIKQVPIDAHERNKELHDLIFKEAVTKPKFRKDGTKRDFNYQSFVDDEAFKNVAQLKLKFYTPGFFDCDVNLELTQRSMGEEAVMVALPDAPEFFGELELYLQTEKYYKQNIGVSGDTRKAKLIDTKKEKNTQRRERLVRKLHALLESARIYVRASEITDRVGSGVPARFESAFNELLVAVYTSALAREFTEQDILDNLSQRLVVDDPSTMQHYTSAIVNVLNKNNSEGMQKTLDCLIGDMDKAPYGWTSPSVRAVVAYMVANSTVELIKNSTILSIDECRSALCNRGDADKVIVHLVEAYSGKDISQLRNFYRKFFNEGISTNEPKALAENTAKKFGDYAANLRKYDATGMACRERLNNMIAEFERISRKSRAYFYTDLPLKKDELFGWKDNLLDPFEEFFNGNQYTLYKEAKTFLKESDTDKLYISELYAQISDIVNVDEPYNNTSKYPELRPLMGEATAELERQFSVLQSKIEDELKDKEASFDLSFVTEANRKEAKQSLQESFASLKTKLSRLTHLVELALFKQNRLPMAYEEIERLLHVKYQAKPVTKVDQPSVTIQEIEEKEKTNTAVVTKKVVASVPVGRLKTNTPITSTEELDAYLRDLRALLSDQLRNAKAITIE